MCFFRRLFFVFGTIFAVLFGVSYAVNGYAQIDDPRSDVPILVELFTSQSCSSCPPADENLRAISGFKNVIVLGCHVTYWDHLYWKDELSQESCTQRQRMLNKRMGRGDVFTPQAVINGRYSIVGNRRSALSSGLKEAALLDVGRLSVQVNDGVPDVVILNEIYADESARIVVIKYLTTSVIQKIKGGENRGKEVEYVHPVVDVQEMTPAAFDALTYGVDEGEGVVVIVEGDGRIILGDL